MTYSLGHTHNPLGHNPTTIGHILYLVIFGETFALMKPVDSEHKRSIGLEKRPRGKSRENYVTLLKMIHEILRL